MSNLRSVIERATEWWRGVVSPGSRVAVTFSEDGGGHESPHVTTWSYDRRRFGDEVRIVFRSPRQMRRFGPRWRILARAIHESGREDGDFRFDRVRIHCGDGVFPHEPQDVVAFARRPGSRVPLIPNTYLLSPRPALPAPKAWEAKNDTLYFRGASTGCGRYEDNPRVAFCRAAAVIPRSDCRISKLRQIDDDFARRLHADGLVARPDPVGRLNEHRYLADVDGNTSSWDRFLLIGMFGGVPIRFEPAWEECWHGALVEGENFVRADRHTLAAVVERLRGRDDEARRIADQAAQVVRTVLDPKALRGHLRQVLGAGLNGG